MRSVPNCYVLTKHQRKHSAQCDVEKNGTLALTELTVSNGIDKEIVKLRYHMFVWVEAELNSSIVVQKKKTSRAAWRMQRTYTFKERVLERHELGTER